MFLLVPHNVGTTTAVLWLAAIDETLPLDELSLVPELPGSSAPVDFDQWPPGSSRPRIRYCRFEISGLAPRQSVSFAATVDGRIVADAKAVTLPERMPAAAGEPFTVLLGSCFSRLEDADGSAAGAFMNIEPRKPDVKILAGDQVYLDSPFTYFLRPHSLTELHKKFSDEYKATWGRDNALRTILKQGANYFSADDHEFWNNAPNIAPHLADTLPLIGKREEWWKAARELYGAFQGGKALQRFCVPPVSFLIVDTRINRSNRETQFMRGEDLEAVDHWVRTLAGPGVLVIGQPLLRMASGFTGHLTDWNLPDYEQFEQLTRIIGKCRHSLVLLTGDVHYGRIAVGRLRSGADFVEIISSPMSLVDKKAKGKWAEAPKRSAGFALAPEGLRTLRDFAPNDTHFLTLELTRRGNGAHMKVRHWPIGKAQARAGERGREVWETTLR